MLILDCSSRTQALHTLSAGFGCPPEKLKKVLLSLDLESIYELNPRQLVDAPQYLREYVCAELGEPGPFTRALWFHGIRIIRKCMCHTKRFIKRFLYKPGEH